MQDWLTRPTCVASVRRFEMIGKGTSLFEPTRRGTVLTGWLLLFLATLPLTGGFSLL